MIKRIDRYGDAKDLLAERLGDFCSYCERPTAHAVEHVLPWGDRNVGTKAVPVLQKQHPRLENSWTNFLLTCTKCNNFKKSRQVATPYGYRRPARAKYYWPDTDNTFRAFEYHPNGDVTPHGALVGPSAQKAADTLAMFGFGTANDIRKRKRAEAWACAQLQLAVWNACPTAGTLEAVASSASLGGHWSIWRTVFAAHPRVLERLNLVFPGTERGCFVTLTGAALPRRKGQL